MANIEDFFPIQIPKTIAVNPGMNLAIPQEMVERWHQDLRKIIELQEANGRLQLLVYETQDKVTLLNQSLKCMAEKLATHQSAQNDEVGESKRNKELTTTVQQLQASLTTLEKIKKEGDAKILSLERINSNTVSTLTQCQNNLTARNEEVSRLKSRLEEIRKALAEQQGGSLHSLRVAFETEQMGRKQAVKRVEELERELTERNTTIERYASLNGDLLNQRAGLQNEVARLKGTDPYPAQDTIRRLQEEQIEANKRHSEEITKEKIVSQNLRREAENLHALLNRMKGINQSVNNDAYTMGQQMMDSNQKLAKAERELAHLQNSYQIIDKERVKLINDNIILKQDRDRLQKMTEGMTVALNRLQGEKKELSNHLLTYQDTVKEWNTHTNKQDEEIDKLEEEVIRLKEGRFTEEEFQALCHQFQQADCRRFCKGCLDYWLNLFGKDKLTPVLIEAAVKVITKAQLRWTHRDHESMMRESGKGVDEAFAEDVVASLFELYAGNSCAERSKPEIKINEFPLPVIHSDFEFTLERINDSKLPHLEPIKEGGSSSGSGTMNIIT